MVLKVVPLGSVPVLPMNAKEGTMKTKWLCGGVALLASLVAEAAGPVKVNVSWEYKDFAAKVEVREIKGRPQLWETQSVKSLTQAPVGEKLGSAAFFVEPGQKKRFALVINNDSDKPLYFFAAPHVVNPAEHALGFHFMCLCINHAFSVGPRETWYRIVEFSLSEEFVGSELTLTHAVIGIDKGRADAFAAPKLPQMLRNENPL